MAEPAAPAKTGLSRLKTRMPMTVVLVVIVAIVEGLGFYTATKLFGGGPQVAYGEEGQNHVLDGEDPGSLPSTAEVELLKNFKVPNDKRGRLYIYDFDITVKVSAYRQEEFRQLVDSRKHEISDRIARLVRAADPPVLHEPELKTLRMQIQHAVGDIAGDQEVVLEVLIPRCVPIRSD
jgi:flagellar basal body-associated protein FliL